MRYLTFYQEQGPENIIMIQLPNITGQIQMSGSETPKRISENYLKF